ncbi:metal-sensitive transcriptional regulator [Euzebya tangerina]|uniref:metal-sensitive transcriptional regulator n=1 Tax=Euzebya tangerina TaxID=591198 RepID=UPI000E321E8D|nr:metal-sensitive transcriptional regulator [Euzebya tangerina]
MSAEPGYVTGGDQAALLRRLKRIEGQVRGVHRMVEEDTYCIDVLTQVSAIKRGLEKVSVLLVEDHLRGCVLDAAKSGDDAEADAHLTEVTTALGRLLRS